jgi:hypothetical protein
VAAPPTQMSDEAEAAGRRVQGLEDQTEASLRVKSRLAEAEAKLADVHARLGDVRALAMRVLPRDAGGSASSGALGQALAATARSGAAGSPAKRSRTSAAATAAQGPVRGLLEQARAKRDEGRAALEVERLRQMNMRNELAQVTGQIAQTAADNERLGSEADAADAKIPKLEFADLLDEFKGLSPPEIEARLGRELEELQAKSASPGVRAVYEALCKKTAQRDACPVCLQTLGAVTFLSAADKTWRNPLSGEVCPGPGLRGRARTNPLRLPACLPGART